MSTTRIRIDPHDPSTVSEAEIAAQEREDQALQDMARYTRRVRRMGLGQTEVARDDPQSGAMETLPDRGGAPPVAGARQGL